MIKIPLTNRKKEIVAYTLVDDEEFEWLSRWEWYITAGYASRTHSYGSKGKRQRKTISMAIEIMKYHGLYDKNKFVDHANRNRLDNRKYNLRMVTKSQNAMNREKQTNNTSGYKGVYFYKSNKTNPWKAQIRTKNKNKGIGYYKTAIEAAYAYDEKAKKLHGEFARLNFET